MVDTEKQGLVTTRGWNRRLRKPSLAGCKYRSQCRQTQGYHTRKDSQRAGMENTGEVAVVLRSVRR